MQLLHQNKFLLISSDPGMYQHPLFHKTGIPKALPEAGSAHRWLYQEVHHTTNTLHFFLHCLNKIAEHHKWSGFPHLIYFFQKLSTLSPYFPHRLSPPVHPWPLFRKLQERIRSHIPADTLMYNADWLHLPILHYRTLPSYMLQIVHPHWLNSLPSHFHLLFLHSRQVPAQLKKALPRRSFSSSAWYSSFVPLSFPRIS